MRLQRGKRIQIGVEAGVRGRGLTGRGTEFLGHTAEALMTEISMQDSVK